MSSSAIRVALLFIVLPLAQASGQVAGPPARDTLIVELQSTIPGREVEFRLQSFGANVSIVSAALRTRGDTLLVRTPARLGFSWEAAGARVVLETLAGEPWLHASVVTRGSMEIWGRRLEVSQTGIRGASMRWRSGHVR